MVKYFYHIRFGTSEFEDRGILEEPCILSEERCKRKAMELAERYAISSGFIILSPKDCNESIKLTDSGVPFVFTSELRYTIEPFDYVLHYKLVNPV